MNVRVKRRSFILPALALLLQAQLLSAPATQAREETPATAPAPQTTEPAPQATEPAPQATEPKNNHPDGTTSAPHEGGAHSADHYHHRFQKAEEWAKKFEAKDRKEWQKPLEVIELLDLAPTDNVADIGAGTGYFSVRLARAIPKGKVYAVDIEPDMVAYLEERAKKESLANMRVVKANSNSPNLPTPMDLILVVDTYHHIPNRVDYFKRLTKDLKDDGRLVIIDFKKDAPQGPPVKHRKTQSEITGELKLAGYEPFAAYYVLPQQNFLIFRKSSK